MKITPFLKKPLLLVLIGVLATMMVAPAFATESLYISNSELNWYTWQHLQVTTNATRGGRVFTGNDQFLTAVTWYLNNDSIAESGQIRAVLYDNITNIGGGYGPADGSEPAEYSNATYDASQLIHTDLVTFYFDDDTNLTSSQSWAVALQTSSTLGSEIHVGMSISGGTFYDAEGDGVSTYHSYSPIIYIYTNDEAGGGGEPYTPPGAASWTTYDELIENFVAFMVPLLIMLLPAFLLCFISRRVDKWLILIGLAIGAGLGYYFGMVPLWLVFLISIGLIGMAYQSVRGGGGN